MSLAGSRNVAGFPSSADVDLKRPIRFDELLIADQAATLGVRVAGATTINRSCKGGCMMWLKTANAVQPNPAPLWQVNTMAETPAQFSCRGDVCRGACHAAEFFQLVEKKPFR